MTYVNNQFCPYVFLQLFLIIQLSFSLDNFEAAVTGCKIAEERSDVENNSKAGRRGRPAKRRRPEPPSSEDSSDCDEISSRNKLKNVVTQPRPTNFNSSHPATTFLSGNISILLSFIPIMSIMLVELDIK